MLAWSFFVCLFLFNSDAKVQLFFYLATIVHGSFSYTDFFFCTNLTNLTNLLFLHGCFLTNTDEHGRYTETPFLCPEHMESTEGSFLYESHELHECSFFYEHGGSRKARKVLGSVLSRMVSPALGREGVRGRVGFQLFLYESHESHESSFFLRTRMFTESTRIFFLYESHELHECSSILFVYVRRFTEQCFFFLHGCFFNEHGCFTELPFLDKEGLGVVGYY